MVGKYTLIEGISFPKNSDREYVETWESLSDSLLIRKTIGGETVMEGKERCMLTLSGNGDVLPLCTLDIGDTVNVKNVHGQTIRMRFKSWNYKHAPWQFFYNWSYSFVEVER